MTKAPSSTEVTVEKGQDPTESSEDCAPVTASHEVLFESPLAVSCDACGAPLAESDDDEGFDVAGSGVYLWNRGDCIEFERAPLCASCASAIGVTALHRWEIEEEES